MFSISDGKPQRCGSLLVADGKVIDWCVFVAARVTNIAADL